MSPSANQHVNWLAAVFGTPQPGLYRQLPSPQAEAMQLPPLAKRTPVTTPKVKKTLLHLQRR